MSGSHFVLVVVGTFLSLAPEQLKKLPDVTRMQSMEI